MIGKSLALVVFRRPCKLLSRQDRFTEVACDTRWLPVNSFTTRHFTVGYCYCSKPTKLNLKDPTKKEKLSKYLLSRYENLVQNYELVLEKKFPSAMRVYQVFKIGIKDFYLELKEFLRIVKKVNSSFIGSEELTRRELETYYQMPRDMISLAPVLILSAIPFSNYIIFPLAYYFPRQLLSYHFWSLQQRIQFAVIEQKNRLRYYKPVFRCLQAQINKVSGKPAFHEWNSCIALLGSGMHPSIVQIMAAVPLFEEYPYKLDQLSTTHLRALCKMHNIHSWWIKHKRLYERAEMIHLMDTAIRREGGVLCMTQEEVRKACFLRGLNPTNMNHQEAVVWLADWVSLSSAISSKSYSLLLHAPILLAYNHPSNWVLTHN